MKTRSLLVASALFTLTPALAGPPETCSVTGNTKRPPRACPIAEAEPEPEPAADEAPEADAEPVPVAAEPEAAPPVEAPKPAPRRSRDDA